MAFLGVASENRSWNYGMKTVIQLTRDFRRGLHRSDSRAGQLQNIGLQSVVQLVHSLCHSAVPLSASSFQFQCHLFSLRLDSSCLRRLNHLVPSTFPSITCSRRQFLPKIWPIQLTFHLFTVCRTFLSPLTLCNTSHFPHDRSNWSSPSFYSTTQSYNPHVALHWFLP